MSRSCARSSYGLRTGCVRPLWVFLHPPARQTGRMTRMTRRTRTMTSTVLSKAAGLVGAALFLALPVVAPHARETNPPRTIDVELSRYTFAPERIDVRVGERVRLNITSVDATHGFEIKALGLSARIPGSGKTVTLELTPTEPGTFEIRCSEYCGRGHRGMKARLIVTPGT